MVLFDNLPNGGSIGGAPLDAVLTSPSKNGRVLGESRMAGDLPWNTVLYATGNNLSVVGDGLRRILPIRLESPEERPETRTNFAIKEDLLDHVLRNRPALVAAALTILRGYVVAGRPEPEVPLKAMDYPAWSRLVRHAVHWATGYDPGATREEMIATDSEAIDRSALIDGLAELPGIDKGLTAAEILRILAKPENSCWFETLRDVMAEWTSNRETPTPKILGKRLKAIRGKMIKGKCITSTINRKTQRWRIVGAHPGGSGGSGGSATPFAGEPEKKEEEPWTM